MCGSFSCTKQALMMLNIHYVVTAIILISVAVYSRASSLVTNLPIIGGIIACGVFLIFLAILGMVATIKHHQVMLFFYMVILFMLFLVQFWIACACLTVDSLKQEMLAKEGWNQVNMEVRRQVQDRFLCCGFETRIVPFNHTADFPSCDLVDTKCCALSGDKTGCGCEPCMDILRETIKSAFKLCGGIGLFFSITEFMGGWLTIKYRNQKDPRAKSSDFL